MFKVHDRDGNPMLIDADHFRAGIEGVVFTDCRGKIVEAFDWNEIRDVDIETVHG